MSGNVKDFGAVKRFSEIMNDDINRLPRPNFRLCFFLFSTQQTLEVNRFTFDDDVLYMPCGNGSLVVVESRL